MTEATQAVFGPFRLDVADRRLWQGQQAVELTPQAFTLLAHLVKHSGRLITKEELMQAVWKETVVSDDALYAVMSEVRRALGDDPQQPQLIKTEPKRGYRFIGTMRSGPSSVVSAPPTMPLRSYPATATWHLPLGFVGREGELQQLHRLLEKALAGERQMVFLTGEPGIGKTTLVEAFLHGLTVRVQ